jgi:hypothetical protein
VRLSFKQFGRLATLGLFLLPFPAAAQNPVNMDPDQNAAKAKQLVKQAIEAMGGPLYRDQSESECEGRVAQFDRNGSMMGLSNIRSYWNYPDKNRTEYVVNSTKGGYLAVLVGTLPVKGGMYVQLFNGERGWTMDKSGVNEADATAVGEFQNAMKRQVRNLLLNRVNEDGVFLSYAGMGIADLLPVEWIEITDRDDRKIRLALDHETHLPARIHAITTNEEMHDRDEDITIFSNYKEFQGIQTPMQVSREHNGRRTHQIFYSACTNSPNLPANFFTEQSLQQKFKDTGGKAKPEK